MNRHISGVACIGVALLAIGASPSQAALTAYANQATFQASTLSSAIDTFTGFSIVGATASPITRTVGAYSYVATAANGFYGAGTTINPALSTNAATDSITFSSFTGPVSAIGGLFYGTDVNGSYASGGTITLIATDSLGASLSQTFSAATISNFAGFTSTGLITTLVISEASTGFTVYPTIDNLTLAQAVPEPATWALLAVGLLGVLLAPGRRVSAAVEP